MMMVILQMLTSVLEIVLVRLQDGLVQQGL